MIRHEIGLVYQFLEKNLIDSKVLILFESDFSLVANAYQKERDDKTYMIV